METQTAIFLGPPGSGKGTQSDLLAEFLINKKDAAEEVLEIDVGAAFRELANCSTAVSQRVKEKMNDGDLLPTFLSAYLWTDELINNMASDSHMIMDGSPRRLLEAKLLDQALLFYRREQAVVLHLDTDKNTSLDRLRKRGRSDDSKSVVRRRLNQYEEKTRPVVAYYQDTSWCRYERIDGERSVNAIQDDIRSLLSS